MADIRAIDGGRRRRAETLAEARILQCPCGSRRVREERVGVVLGPSGKVVHRGTLVRVCGECGKVLA
jgi:hypothetical protein